MTYEFIHRAPIASTSLQFDGETYDLHREELESAGSQFAVPSRDHALHLVSTVQFHCGRLFHLFDEHTFMSCFEDFYKLTPNLPTSSDDLWFLQFLLIMAFGKAFSSKKTSSRRELGVPFFNKAISLLPSISILAQEPALGTEILCCIALYLHCFDHRMSAYNYVSLVNYNMLHCALKFLT